VPEWFRERSAKPRTRVRFPSSPPHSERESGPSDNRIGPTGKIDGRCVEHAAEAQLAWLIPVDGPPWVVDPNAESPFRVDNHLDKPGIVARRQHPMRREIGTPNELDRTHRAADA
jgi:hypothetical protein